MKKGLNRINMEIKIKKIDCHQVDGSASDMISTYNVMQNNREFRITCRSNISAAASVLTEWMALCIRTEKTTWCTCKKSRLGEVAD